MTQTPSRDWQKDMEMFTAGVEQSRRLGFAATIESSPYQVAIHWLQEAKELQKIASGRGGAYLKIRELLIASAEQERKLAEAIQTTITEFGLWNDKALAASVMHGHLEHILSTLYPDTPAQPVAPALEITARPIEEWHEDMGCVIWWEFPISEPPHCGTPLDIDWPGYHTHWTPIVIPAAPAPKEGTPDDESI